MGTTCSRHNKRTSPVSMISISRRLFNFLVNLFKPLFFSAVFYGALQKVDVSSR